MQETPFCWTTLHCGKGDVSCATNGMAMMNNSMPIVAERPGMEVFRMDMNKADDGKSADG